MKRTPRLSRRNPDRPDCFRGHSPRTPRLRCRFHWRLLMVDTERGPRVYRERVGARLLGSRERRSRGVGHCALDCRPAARCDRRPPEPPVAKLRAGCGRRPCIRGSAPHRVHGSLSDGRIHRLRRPRALHREPHDGTVLGRLGDACRWHAAINSPQGQPPGVRGAAVRRRS